MASSKWRKAKLALGFNSCLYASRTSEDSPPSNDITSGRLSDVVSSSSLICPTSGSDCQPTTPIQSSSGLQFPKSGTKSSKIICAICLTSIIPGQGHAIFTAECSHSFHFHCITSNVKHGNQICPVCRAKWKEIPFQHPPSDLCRGTSRRNSIALPLDNALQQLPSPLLDTRQQIASVFHPPEPTTFDDDEVLNEQLDRSKKRTTNVGVADNSCIGAMVVKTFPEVPAVSRSTSHNGFNVLIHLKAPLISQRQNNSRDSTKSFDISQNSWVPVDLVTVLDVSGSMSGTKLALLKRAMAFVVQNLGPSDRLSVIAFSSTARRLFPLRWMTDAGRQQALQSINSLFSNGGTNIAEGLRKGAKVLLDRKWENPVCSIILLSDGQDTYTVNSPSETETWSNYQSLLPVSIRQNNCNYGQTSVHAFGFGADHDASLMHLISENSGGTFSFIEDENVIQDAFAQCIGGLLNVVVQQLWVEIECVHPHLRLSSIKAGSYPTNTTENKRKGSISVGDLYAEEERDFLVTINIPVDELCTEMSLLRVSCFYKDPITKEMVSLEEVSRVKIQRPEIAGQLVVSVEVDKQRNRLSAAEAMAEARVAAENDDLAGAVSILVSCQKCLMESASAQAGDLLCAALCAELKEMQERMANWRFYEESGRAYVLSGLSSHAWQRATARGDSTELTSLVQSYQTPSMVDMVNRSQELIFGNQPPPGRSYQSALFCPVQAQPRFGPRESKKAMMYSDIGGLN